MAQTVKNPPAIQDTWVWSLGWEDPLEEDMATHSSILAWRIPMGRGSWRAVENSERWEFQTIWTASWETCIQVKKQQLELDMEQWTGFKLVKEYNKAVYCHPAYLTYI